MLEPLAVSSLGSQGARCERSSTGPRFPVEFTSTRRIVREPAGAGLAKREFDAVVVETHYMVPYLPSECLRSRSIFDSQNSEIRRISTMASTLGLSVRGLVARLQRGAVVRFERASWRARRGRSPCRKRRLAILEHFRSRARRSRSERCRLRELQPRSAVPGAAEILFLGSLDYSANIDALAFLVDSVAPLIQRRDAAALGRREPSPRRGLRDRQAQQAGARR